MKTEDKIGITAIEMKLIRLMATYVRVLILFMEYKREENMLKGFRREPTLISVLNYITNWIQHIDRISRNIQVRT
jgi:hypothetical protein